MPFPPISPILARMAPLPSTTNFDAATRAPNGKAPARHTRFRYWHTAIIDDMIAFPTDTPKARAERLGYHPFTIASLIRSDMFQEALKARRKHFERLLDESLVQKALKVANQGLDVLSEQLTKKRDNLPFAEVAETTTSVLEMLGYGPKKGGGATVVVNNNTGDGTQQVAVTASAETIASARGKLRQLEQQNAEQSPPRPSLSQGSPPGPLVIEAKPEASRE